MAETCSQNELEKKLNNHARHALKFYFLWATPKIPELHIEFFGTLACITYHKKLTNYLSIAGECHSAGDDHDGG